MSPTVATRISPAPLRRAALALAAAFAFLPSAAQALVSVSQAVGTVQIRKAGGAAWGSITGAGHVLSPGDEIKTGRASRVVLTFDDGSKVDIGANGSFTLEEAQKSQASMRFNLGSMRAWVTKALSRKFQVKTPTAVCSVRGTEFGVDVAQGGNTNIAVFSGLVGVADGKGNEVLLSEGQKVDVTQAGITQKAQGGGTEQGADKTRQALKREVGLDMSKEEVQAAAAAEIKSAVYQEGKAIIDINGNRVRIEQYIIRPQPTQFKLVVLNERTDRFDYFYYLGTFNKTLPDDLSVALRQTQGQAFTKPEYFLSSFETGRSNTTDKVVENASGGHLVDINNNNDLAAVTADCVAKGTCDDVQAIFDPKIDGVVRLNVPSPGRNGNDPYWITYYDKYSLAYNNVVHTSWDRATGVVAYSPLTDTGGIQSYSVGAAGQTAAQIARNDVVNCVGPLCATPSGCTDGDHCTYEPQPGKVSFNVYRENTGGTIWDKTENYIISDEGKLANKTDFAGITSGAAFKSTLMKWNYQQIMTASEFNGRKIDLAVSPRILIESGLIP